MKRLKAKLWRKKSIKSMPNSKLHWTKLDKPIGEMNPEERRAAAEKLARGSLEALLNENQEET